MKDTLHHPFHFYVVDDDKDDQVFFSDAIQHVLPNASVTCFSDGTEIMNCLYEGEIMPDLIFLDLKMHKQDGRETLVLIKQNEYFFHIPTIILTESTSMKDRMDLIDLGADGYYNKPSTPAEMSKIVEKVCKGWLESRFYKAL